MEFTYYPGCSVESSSRHYDMSTRALCKQLGITLSELEDWNCCGATAYMSVQELRAFAISGRNLALAERHGKDVITACPACYLALYKTNDYVSKYPDIKAKVNTALSAADLKYEGSVKIRHLLDVIANDYGTDLLAQRVKHPLKGLKVAPYHGCQLTRPFAAFDRYDDPKTLDRVLEAVGAEPVSYPLTTRCCGGMMMTTAPDVAKKLVGDLLKCARDSGADCICVACPLCYVNLDSYQDELPATQMGAAPIPIFFFTQLLGLSVGIDKRELGFHMSLVPAEPALSKIETPEPVAAGS
jgi:heterodisulfide reductase subunit B